MSAPGRRAVRTARTRRLVAAAVALIGGIAMILAAFQTWISTANAGGDGRTAIAGFGAITGGGLSGTNLNSAMQGYSSYRPGLVALIAGAVTVLAAVVLLASRGGWRNRPITTAMIAAGVAAAAGVVALVWGLLRGLAPGDAGVLDPGEGAPGVGPWLTALGGLLALGSAAAFLSGRLDPPSPVRRRPIQPR